MSTLVLKFESSKVLKFWERKEETELVLKFEPASLEATPRRGSSKVLKFESSLVREFIRALVERLET